MQVVDHIYHSKCAWFVFELVNRQTIIGLYSNYLIFDSQSESEADLKLISLKSKYCGS